jgi:hypothetical protein
MQFSFAEALTFGALISATDPVSTLAIFAELRVDPTLFYLGTDHTALTILHSPYCTVLTILY